MIAHVACAPRGRYVAHCAALAHSLLANGRFSDLRLHVLHGPDLTRRGRRRLERAAEGQARFHAVADEQVAGLPVHGYFTPAMWYRILLPELLGEPRVLYLDVDTLVLDGLDELWRTPLDGAYLGAVTNVFQADHRFHAGDLGIALSDYFNSGVLLLDLAALRRDDCAARIRETALARAGLRGWPDQDALNLVLGPRRVALHPRYNAMNALFELPEADEVFGAADADQARQAPAIRHFEGPADNKPWGRNARVPHGDRWREQRRAARLGFRP